MSLQADAATVRGIILLAHGSRDPLWKQPIEAVAAHIRSTTLPSTPNWSLK